MKFYCARQDESSTDLRYGSMLVSSVWSEETKVLCASVSPSEGAGGGVTGVDDRGLQSSVGFHSTGPVLKRELKFHFLVTQIPQSSMLFQSVPESLTHAHTLHTHFMRTPPQHTPPLANDPSHT